MIVKLLDKYFYMFYNKLLTLFHFTKIITYYIIYSSSYTYMDPNTIEQILNLIDKSKNILLLTHAKADCDGLGAVLSTYLVLKDLGKEVTAVTNDPTPENLAFLPAMNIVQNSLSSSKDFIITLNIMQTPISKIKYNLEDNNRVNIVITPKGGFFSGEGRFFLAGGANSI